MRAEVSPFAPWAKRVFVHWCLFAGLLPVWNRRVGKNSTLVESEYSRQAYAKLLTSGLLLFSPSPAMSESEAAPVREIRKYANRRLYDLRSSRYINREELRRLIAGGEQVRVIDESSGDDITRSLLLQLLAEQEQGGTPVLSNEILVELIRYYEHPMQALFARYLQQSMQAFMEQRQGMQGQLQELLDRLPGAELARENLDRWSDLQQELLDSLSQRSGRRRRK